MGAHESHAPERVSEWSFSYEGHNPVFEDSWSKLPRDVIVDKIRGLVYGQAIGDALGLATEFMNKGEAEGHYGKDGPQSYMDAVQDSHRSRWRCGDWTDDTDQMILMLASLTNFAGKASPTDLADRLLIWRQYGFKELGDRGGMGIGATTERVLTSAKFEEYPHQAAEDVWQASGCFLAANGAVMRTSIAGAANFNDMEKVLWQTREFCLVTHADPRCVASCTIVTAAIALMLQGEYDASVGKDVSNLIKHSVQLAGRFLEGDKVGMADFLKHVNVKSWSDLKLDDFKAIGYTFKAMGAGIYGLRSSTDFRRTITELVMEAGDADSNASVCGALLGCKYGYSGLPSDLLDGLVHHAWLDKLVDMFLAMMGLRNAPREGPSAAASTAEAPKNVKQSSDAPPAAAAAAAAAGGGAAAAAAAAGGGGGAAAAAAASSGENENGAGAAKKSYGGSAERLATATAADEDSAGSADSAGQA